MWLVIKSLLIRCNRHVDVRWAAAFSALENARKQGILRIDQEDKRMKKIGVLSDTHGKLREEVIDVLQACDVILHAGDINTSRVLEKLREIAPVYAVRGNADKEWAQMLPATLDEEIFGLRIYMVHNKKELPGNLAKYDLAVYGHSHKFEAREGECFYLNPGSCGPRRFSLPVTMAVIEVEEDRKFSVTKIDLVNVTEGKTAETGYQEKGDFTKQSENFAAWEIALTEKTLTLLLRDVDKGKNFAQIAGKYGISEEAAEQICRLYLTHPGIGAAGVLEKLALPRDR